MAIAEGDGGSVCDEGEDDDSVGIFPAAGVVDGAEVVVVMLKLATPMVVMAAEGTLISKSNVFIQSVS